MPARERAAGLVRAVAQTHEAEQSAAAVERAWQWLAERAHWDVAVLFDHLLAQVEPLIGVVESPENSLDDEALARGPCGLSRCTVRAPCPPPVGNGGVDDNGLETPELLVGCSRAGCAVLRRAVGGTAPAHCGFRRADRFRSLRPAARRGRGEPGAQRCCQGFVTGLRFLRASLSWPPCSGPSARRTLAKLGPFGPALDYHRRGVPCLCEGLCPIDGSVDRRLLVDVRPVGRAGRTDPPFAVVAAANGQLFTRRLVHRNPPCLLVCRGARQCDLGARRFGFLLQNLGHHVDGQLRLGVFMHQAFGFSLDVERFVLLARVRDQVCDLDRQRQGLLRIGQWTTSLYSRNNCPSVVLFRPQSRTADCHRWGRGVPLARPFRGPAEASDRGVGQAGGGSKVSNRALSRPAREPRSDFIFRGGSQMTGAHGGQRDPR